MPPKLTTKLKHNLVEALMLEIAKVVSSNDLETDDDKLLAAVLDEVHLKLKKKTVEDRVAYTISFTASEAIALRLLYICYVQDHTTQLGNVLHSLSNQVHQELNLLS